MVPVLATPPNDVNDPPLTVSDEPLPIVVLLAVSFRIWPALSTTLSFSGPDGPIVRAPVKFSVPLLKAKVPLALTIRLPVVNVPPFSVSVWKALTVVLPLRITTWLVAMFGLGPRAPPASTVKLPRNDTEPAVKLIMPPLATSVFKSAIPPLMLIAPVESNVVVPPVAIVSAAPPAQLMVPSIVRPPLALKTPPDWMSITPSWRTNVVAPEPQFHVPPPTSVNVPIGLPAPGVPMVKPLPVDWLTLELLPVTVKVELEPAPIAVVPR